MDLIQDLEQHSRLLRAGSEFHSKVDVKCEPEELQECELIDLKEEACLKLEFEETSVDMGECVSSVKKEYDDMKLEDQELVIKNENAVDHELFNTEMKKLGCNFENGSYSAGDSQKYILVCEGSRMFRCAECGLRSKRKYDIKRHMLVHKDPSQVEMFKCDECDYQSIQRCSLNRHMLVHRDPSQVQMFRCNECRYETRHKHCLKEHMLVHKDPSETEVFKCHECNYQSKHKSSLKRHKMLHIDPPDFQMQSQVQIFKCNQCNYQSKQRRYLTQHMLVHKDPSTIEMFKCDQCNHRSKLKGNLKRHIAVHKKRAECSKFLC